MRIGRKDVQMDMERRISDGAPEPRPRRMVSQVRLGLTAQSRKLTAPSRRCRTHWVFLLPHLASVKPSPPPRTTGLSERNVRPSPRWSRERIDCRSRRSRPPKHYPYTMPKTKRPLLWKRMKKEEVSRWRVDRGGEAAGR